MIGDFDDCWTLRAADRALLGNKSGATRLGFAVLLKLFQAEGRFPRRPEDVPAAAVEAIAAQVGVPAAAWLRLARPRHPLPSRPDPDGARLPRGQGGRRGGAWPLADWPGARPGAPA